MRKSSFGYDIPENQPTRKLKDEAPPDEIEKALLDLSNSMIELGKDIRKMSRKARKDPKYAKIWENSIFENFGDIKKFNTTFLDTEVEVSLWKKLTDDREKLTILDKMAISELLKYYNTRSVAKIAGVTPKWLKSKNFNKNGEIELAKQYTEELLEYATGKKFDYSTWFRKQLNTYEKTRH